MTITTSSPVSGETEEHLPIYTISRKSVKAELFTVARYSSDFTLILLRDGVEVHRVEWNWIPTLKRIAREWIEGCRELSEKLSRNPLT